MSNLSDKIERAQQPQQRGGAVDLRPVDAMARHLRDAEAQFAAALPASIPAQQFVRILVTEVRKNPDLADCSPASLLGAAMLCAQHALPPGNPLGLAYLIPRRSGKRGTRDVEFQLGYRGMLELAARSGVAVEGHTVREGDEFEVVFGSEGFIRHRPKFDAVTLPRSYAWWAVGRHVDGREWREALGRAQVEHYRAKSQMPNGGAWQTDYDAMALKTVVRRLSTFLPMTGSAAAAVAADGAVAQYQAGSDELDIEYQHEAIDVDETSDELAAADEAPADENGEATA